MSKILDAVNDIMPFIAKGYAPKGAVLDYVTKTLFEIADEGYRALGGLPPEGPTDSALAARPRYIHSLHWNDSGPMKMLVLEYYREGDYLGGILGPRSMPGTYIFPEGVLLADDPIQAQQLFMVDSRIAETEFAINSAQRSIAHHKNTIQYLQVVKHALETGDDIPTQ